MEEGGGGGRSKPPARPPEPVKEPLVFVKELLWTF